MNKHPVHAINIGYFAARLQYVIYRLSKYLASNITLTDMTFRCPDSLIKTTPPPPWYPWVS